MSQPIYVYQAWPAWRYGPNGEAEIFEAEEQVPEGWVEHPSMLAVDPEPENADNPVKRRGRPPKAAVNESDF